MNVKILPIEEGFSILLHACKISKCGPALGVKASLSSIPGITQQKEKTKSHRLSSEHNTHTVARVYTHVHTHTHGIMKYNNFFLFSNVLDTGHILRFIVQVLLNWNLKEKSPSYILSLILINIDSSYKQNQVSVSLFH